MGLLGHLLPKNTLLIIGNQSWIEENSGRFFVQVKLVDFYPAALGGMEDFRGMAQDGILMGKVIALRRLGVKK